MRLSASFLFLTCLGVLFGTATSAAENRTTEPRLTKNTNNKLLLSIRADRRTYKQGDKIKLEVILSNSSNSDMYVFGTLEWGPSASFLLHLRDSKGRAIPVLADDLTPPISPDDMSAFVKLRPQHLIGTNLQATPNFLGMRKPGKYAIVVEYRSPIHANVVTLSPFWARESGSLKSNVIWIQVVK